MRAKNFIISVSIASMIHQPVALAQASKNVNAGKTITYKKFWDQNKDKFNPQWQQVFNPAIRLQKNDAIPKMETINIKGPRGTSSERMIMNIDGKTVSIEFLGGEEKFARINNTVISYADFYYGTGMIEKLSKDPVIAAENEKLKNQVMTRSATPTYQQYKAMSVEERGQLLLMTRLAAEAANDVLMIAAQAEAKKTASNFFMETFLPQAEAKGSSVIGLPCLVGGYEGKIVNKGRVFCDPDSGIKEFNSRNPELAKSTGCSGSSFGCHPVNFPSSGGICFSKTNRQSMQTMTKQCGDRSPYQTPKDQARLVEEYQKKLGKSVTVELKDGKVVDEKVYNEVVKPYMDQFNELNRSAFERVCNPVNRLKVEKTVDPEIDSACNTLEQRKISLELFKEAERPGPVVPVPAPIAGDGEVCKDNQGREGRKDKEGKCIVVAVAPPVETCESRGQTEVTDVNGEKKCNVAVAARIGSDRVAAASRAPTSPSFFSTGAGRFTIAGVILLSVAYLFNKWSKKGIKVSPPIAAQPPASPPLPPPPQQPANPTPVPPISEGGQGAPAAPIAAPGSQR